MLELIARGGISVGEVAYLKPADIQERSLVIQNPKSGRVGETVGGTNLSVAMQSFSCHLLLKWSSAGHNR